MLFQPHRFTRTNHLMDDFGTAFHQADDVFLLDIYAASEKPIEGVSGEALADKFAPMAIVPRTMCAPWTKGIEAIAAAAEPGDLSHHAGGRHRFAGGRQDSGTLKGAADGTAA